MTSSVRGSCFTFMGVLSRRNSVIPLIVVVTSQPGKNGTALTLAGSPGQKNASDAAQTPPTPLTSHDKTPPGVAINPDIKLFCKMTGFFPGVVHLP